MKYLIVAILLLLVVPPAQAQSPACTWPADAAYHDTNATQQYVAWADGGAIYWMRCADLVTVQMFTGSSPVGLYFDGHWLPYVLHYLLADGSHWQISVVSPANPMQIGPPTNPLVTDTPGEAHGDEPLTASSPTPTYSPAAIERQPYPLWLWIRQLFRRWFN